MAENKKYKNIRATDLWSGLMKGRIQDKYQNITKLKQYTDLDLWNIQVNKLNALTNMGSSSLQYKNASEVVLNSNKQLADLNAKLPVAVTNAVYSKIIELLNLGLWGNESNPTRRWKEGLITEEARDRKVQEAISLLDELLDYIGVHKTLKKEVIDFYTKRITKQSGKNEIYTQVKADYTEKLAVDILSKNKGWKVLQTGRVADELGLSIIQDIMAFDRTDLKKQFKNQAGVSVSYDYAVKTSGGKIQKTAQSLDDLFRQIESLQVDEQIQLSNELRDVLEKASVLSTQVKSGRNQNILTEAKRNQVNLNQINFFKEFRVLKEMYYDRTLPWKDKSQQKSKTLSSLANYALSKEIAEETALSKNELYFTEEGFITAGAWMKNKHRLLKFTPEVQSMGNDFETAQRRYQLYKVAARG